MNPLWFCAIVALIGGIGALVLQLRNKKFANSEEARDAYNQTQNFAEQVLTPGETLLLSDYSPSMKAHVVLSDKGVHYMQKKRNKEVRFDAAYSDIVKCDYLNFTSDKVRSDGDVVHIKLKTKNGSCTLYSFPKAKEIARELAGRGFEKRSLL